MAGDPGGGLGDLDPAVDSGLERAVGGDRLRHVT